MGILTVIALFVSAGRTVLPPSAHRLPSLAGLNLHILHILDIYDIYAHSHLSSGMFPGIRTVSTPSLSSTKIAKDEETVLKNTSNSRINTDGSDGTERK